MTRPFAKQIRAAAGMAAASLLLAAGAHAATRTLYVGMNGGSMEKTYTDFVFKAFEKANDVKIVVVPGTSSDIMAKALASRAKPQMHVMFLDDGLMYRAIRMGLCEKQPASAAGKALYPQAHIEGDMATGVTMSMTGLGYNTRLFKEKNWAPPTSWQDLADPKYKNKVVFQSLPSSTFGLHGFLMLNRIRGGNESNVEPGFKAWPQTVGPNVLEYVSNSAKLSEMVQSGEAAIFPFTPSMTTIFQGKGLPVAYAQPKEGAVVLMVAQCVIANNSEPELSQKLAAYLLTAAAQKAALEGGSYNPTNTEVTATGKAGQELAQMKEYLKTAVTVDWSQINQNRSNWDRQWNRQVER
ncbi:extracellular solute-binding protein [Cupriavidus sp. 30B13]|uniref:extracellular solute-binding protein n=1 Tax=Cupriavidus sp. 30B13 TaxID=3384241 RepID=UPI003B91F8C6